MEDNPGDCGDEDTQPGGKAGGLSLKTPAQEMGSLPLPPARAILIWRGPLSTLFLQRGLLSDASLSSPQQKASLEQELKHTPPFLRPQPCFPLRKFTAGLW